MNAVVGWKPVEKKQKTVLIGSRFNGPAILRNGDQYEECMPEPTANAERLQVMLLAPNEPRRWWQR